jgi:hypothetical protein
MPCRAGFTPIQFPGLAPWAVPRFQRWKFLGLTSMGKEKEG